jgi:hypothetical protein
MFCNAVMINNRNINIASIAVSVIMVLCFIVAFPVPPLVDFLAHIGLSLGYANGGGEYYTSTIPVSYKLVHYLVIGVSRLSNSYGLIAASAHVMVLGMLVSTVFIVAASLTQLSTVVVGLIVLLVMPLLHSQSYVWGTVPFFLACWSFIAVSYIVVPLDRRMASGRFDATLFGLLLLFAFFLASEILSHPIGIMLSGLVVAWLAMLQFVHKGCRAYRIALVASVLLVFLCSYFNDYVNNGVGDFLGGRRDMWPYFDKDVAARLKDVGTGEYYSLGRMTNSGPSTPKWYDMSFGWLFSVLPFFCLIIVVADFYKSLVKSNFMLVSSLVKDEKQLPRVIGVLGLAVFCTVIIFGPDNLYKATMLPFRLYAALAPVVIAVTACFLSRFKISRMLIALYPVFMVFFLAVLSPLYVRAQKLVPQAKEAEARIMSSIEAIRRDDHVVLLRYEQGFIFDTWYHTRILPFIMLSDGILFNHKIVIVNEWNDKDLHLPVRFIKQQDRRDVDYDEMAWDMASYPDIRLNKRINSAVWPVYQSTFYDGIDFSLDGYPQFVEYIDGVWDKEGSGRWTVGPVTVIRLKQSLPEKFVLKIKAAPLAPTIGSPVIVKIGKKTSTIIFHDGVNEISLPMTGDGSDKKIVFLFPNAKSPNEINGDSSDMRKLSLFLMHLGIERLP